MSATAFDTLKAAEELTAAGLPEAHAKAIAGTMRNAVSEEVATKADLANLEARIDARIAALETRMVKFGSGLAVAVVAALFGLLRVFGG